MVFVATIIRMAVNIRIFCLLFTKLNTAEDHKVLTNTMNKTHSRGNSGQAKLSNCCCIIDYGDFSFFSKPYKKNIDV